MERRLKILAITGKYGGGRAMAGMLGLASSGGHDVSCYMIDQHQLEGHGFTVNELGLLLREVGVDTGAPMPVPPQGWGRVSTVLLQAAHVAEKVRTGKPDVIIVYGDRLDALVGATLGQQMGVPVAHLQAYDVSGCIDDVTRHAVSTLSKWLFCPTESALRRACADGRSKDAWYVGDHHVDAIMALGMYWSEPPDSQQPHVIVHLHPDTLETEEYNVHMQTVLLETLREEGCRVTAMQPCNDIHGDAMLEALQATRGVSVLAHLPLQRYAALLCHSRGLVGNSSAVLIDAPTLGVPSLLVGNRQRGRNEFGIPAMNIPSPKAIRNFLQARGGGICCRGGGIAGAETLLILEKALS